MKVRFHSAATAELEEALDWYLERDGKAARRFAFAIDHAMNRILSDPEMFSFLRGTFRGCRVTGFPYQIIYRFDKNTLRVQAIAHLSRRPEYWAARD